MTITIFPELESIRKRRKVLELKQSELAKKAGVSQSLIAKIENVKTGYVPGYDMAQKIFGALDKAEVESRGGKERTAKEFMTKKIICVNASDMASKAKLIMEKKGIDQLPVTERTGGRITGAVTSMSLLKAGPKNLVGDVAEEPLLTVRLDTPESLLKELLGEYAAVVVVGKKGELAGIITAQNLFKDRTSD